MRLLSAIYFARPITVPTWRGQKARTYVTDDDAEIKIDLDARIVVLTPKGQGKRTTAPLESVTNWDDCDEPKPAAKPKAA